MTLSANIAVSTVYENLSAKAIDCAGFVTAVEEGIRALPDLNLIEQDETKEHFFVHLGFDEISGDLRAVSVVLGFHAVSGYTPPGADFLLGQYTGHFISGDESARAELLVETLHEELKWRMNQDWLKP